MYLVYLDDGTKFDCGTLHNSLWKDIPDKPITSLVYFISNKKITLSNYEQYNHLIERGTFLYGNSGSIILRVILMGKKGNEVDKITLNLKTNKIEKEVVTWGKEERNKSTTGWKKGVVLTTPDTFDIERC